MKYRINNIKISVKIADQNLEIIKKIKGKIPVEIKENSLLIRKRSLDAREKRNIFYLYTVDFESVKEIKNYQKYNIYLA